MSEGFIPSTIYSIRYVTETLAFWITIKQLFKGVRILGDFAITDSEEAQGLSHYLSNVDIYSNSWGPTDGTGFNGPGSVTKAALQDGVTNGRNGKGAIYIWAAGNGETKDNCNADGYVNSIYTVAISSAMIGSNAWYSEVCAAALAVAYGGSEDDRYLTTTTTSSGCKSNGIQGTSYAAPIASGIVALTLESNPDLTWRDIQHLIVFTSNRNGLNDTYSDWSMNGANKEFSQVMGFGLMNAEAMVSYGKTWTTVPTQHTCNSPTSSPALSTTTSASDSIIVTSGDCSSIHYLEHVVADITFSYTNFRGVAQLFLVSPSGTRSHLLHHRQQDAVDNVAAGSLTWDFMSVHFWKENPIGSWTLEISQKLALATVTLDSWSLKFYGTSTDPWIIVEQTTSPTAADETTHLDVTTKSVLTTEVSTEPITQRTTTVQTTKITTESTTSTPDITTTEVTTEPTTTSTPNIPTTEVTTESTTTSTPNIPTTEVTTEPTTTSTPNIPTTEVTTETTTTSTPNIPTTEVTTEPTTTSTPNIPTTEVTTESTTTTPNIPTTEVTTESTTTTNQIYQLQKLQLKSTTTTPIYQLQKLQLNNYNKHQNIPTTEKLTEPTTTSTPNIPTTEVTTESTTTSTSNLPTTEVTTESTTMLSTMKLTTESTTPIITTTANKDITTESTTLNALTIPPMEATTESTTQNAPTMTPMEATTKYTTKNAPTIPPMEVTTESSARITSSLDVITESTSPITSQIPTMEVTTESTPPITTTMSTTKVTNEFTTPITSLKPTQHSSTKEQTTEATTKDSVTESLPLPPSNEDATGTKATLNNINTPIIAGSIGALVAVLSLIGAIYATCAAKQSISKPDIKTQQTSQTSDMYDSRPFPSVTPRYGKRISWY
ncbi:Hypothetical predicted protein [Mytilus galloprovincialis]|uniref:P/Homo B domain-containing protein n=2 Tax=Mytilus galloprovincialis TaxID=29158 RepID=A0A8B6HTN1_MYTGA|nr:Hypothetical predicted protein [Mytilus galloprovincialis]